MGRLRVGDGAQDLVERCPCRDHDGRRRRAGGDVEQRCARMRRLTGLEHGEARRTGIGPRPALGAHLPPPGEAGERDVLRPVPDVHPAHAARPARAEHLQARPRVGEPALLGQNPLGARPVDLGRGDDRVPVVLGLLLDHRRQPGEVVDGRRGGIDVAHPGLRGTASAPARTRATTGDVRSGSARSAPRGQSSRATWSSSDARTAPRCAARSRSYAAFPSSRDTPTVWRVG